MLQWIRRVWSFAIRDVEDTHIGAETQSLQVTESRHSVNEVMLLISRNLLYEPDKHISQPNGTIIAEFTTGVNPVEDLNVNDLRLGVSCVRVLRISTVDQSAVIFSWS
jgi:hypothetical protein